MKKREIEVFITDCPLCKSVIETIKSLTCDYCNVTYYYVVRQKEEKNVLSKIEEYKITRIPAVVLNGRILSCCENTTITEESLIKAGIGSKIS